MDHQCRHSMRASKRAPIARGKDGEQLPRRARWVVAAPGNTLEMFRCSAVRRKTRCYAAEDPDQMVVISVTSSILLGRRRIALSARGLPKATLGSGCRSTTMIDVRTARRWRILGRQHLRNHAAQ